MTKIGKVNQDTASDLKTEADLSTTALKGRVATVVTAQQSANGVYCRNIGSTGATQLTNIAAGQKVRLYYVGLSNISITSGYYSYGYFGATGNKIWYNELAKNGGGFNANLINIPVEAGDDVDLYSYAQHADVKVMVIFEIMAS